MIFMPLSLPSPPLILWQLFTHVISSIVHIAHEYNDEKEPWPIEIDAINNVPSHWREGIIEDEGSRWVGQVRVTLLYC